MAAAKDMVLLRELEEDHLDGHTKSDGASAAQRLELSSFRAGISLKHLAQNALARAAAGIPLRVRRAMIEALAPDGDFQTFQALARAAGVRAIRVAGAYGLIEGSIYDQAILPKYAQTRSWCDIENRFFVKFFETCREGTYLDIGANIGLTTIPIAQNPRVSCLAFEPEPLNFQYLSDNVGKNCVGGNVELLNLALFDRPGTLKFELSDRNMGDHRVHLDASKGAFEEDRRLTIMVKAERLDDVVRQRTLNGPIAAKLIAQGAEAHIIEGGRSVFSAVEALVVEFYPYAMDRLHSDISWMIGFLGSHFASGAIVTGAATIEPAWQPIWMIVKKMRALAEPGAATAEQYFHVFLRKHPR